MAEAGLERADREQLTVAVGLAERFDLRALHDQHVCLPRFRSYMNGAVGGDSPVDGRLLRIELDDELLAHRHVDLVAQGRLRAP